VDLGIEGEEQMDMEKGKEGESGRMREDEGYASEVVAGARL
jgi:hypothetical protein